VPVCTGKELTDNLLKQIEPFGATFHLGQEVTTVRSRTTAASSSPPARARSS
jgi:thioredoxin reductase (NADPH)